MKHIQSYETSNSNYNVGDYIICDMTGGGFCYGQIKNIDQSRIYPYLVELIKKLTDDKEILMRRGGNEDIIRFMSQDEIEYFELLKIEIDANKYNI